MVQLGPLPLGAWKRYNDKGIIKGTPQNVFALEATRLAAVKLVAGILLFKSVSKNLNGYDELYLESLPAKALFALVLSRPVYERLDHFT